MEEQQGGTSLWGPKWPCLKGGQDCGAGSLCRARMGAHMLNLEVLKFSYFLNFETLQTPIKVVQACRKHHLDSPLPPAAFFPLDFFFLSLTHPDQYYIFFCVLYSF